jgi:hypothetical protein
MSAGARFELRIPVPDPALTEKFKSATIPQAGTCFLGIHRGAAGRIEGKPRIQRRGNSWKVPLQGGQCESQPFNKARFPLRRKGPSLY